MADAVFGNALVVAQAYLYLRRDECRYVTRPALALVLDDIYLTANFAT